MQFVRFKKAPAGMLLFRNAIFLCRKSPCGHVTAQKCYFLRSKKPLRIVFFREKLRNSDVLGYWASRIFKSRVFLDRRQLTRTARPGPVFPVHRKPLRRRGLRGGISIVVGPAARGRVGTGRYPVRFPPRAECGFRRKTTTKLRFRILGVENF